VGGVSRENQPASTGANQSAANQALADANLPDPDVNHLAIRTVRWQRLGMLESGSARIRLEPPELGSVQVTLRNVADSVRVQITVQTDSVRQLLQRHSDQLVQSLQSQGLQAAQVEVTVDRGQQGDASRQSGQQFSQGGGQGQSGGQDAPSRQGQQGREIFSKQFSSEEQTQEELNLTA
jgi:flagellar hook-length control protein FliK